MKSRTNKTINFPNVCILKASYKPIITQPKKYLGNKAEHDRRNRFSITILLKDNKEKIDFLRWWIADLDYGIFPFFITLPIFGRDYFITCRLINDLSSLEVNDSLEVTLELEQLGNVDAEGVVLDDISAHGDTSCVIPIQSTYCTIENTVTARTSGIPDGPIKYVWTVAHAIIKSGQGTGTIVIETQGGSNTLSTVSLTVSDKKVSQTKQIVIEHKRINPHQPTRNLSSADFKNNTLTLHFDKPFDTDQINAENVDTVTIKVNGTPKDIFHNKYTIHSNTNIITVPGILGINAGDVIKVSGRKSLPNSFVDFTDESVLNSGLSVLTPPVYNMDDDLISGNYIKDSANALPDFNGELSFNPTSLEYPKDGTLDIKTNTMNTHYQVVMDNGIYGIYDVVKGTGYKIYAIHLKSGGVADIYLGNQNKPISLSESNKPYVMPTGDWVITDTPPSVIIPTTPTLRRPVYVAIGASDPESIYQPPQGIHINSLTNIGDLTTFNTLLDTDGMMSDISFRFDNTWRDGSHYATSGNNSDCLFDYQLRKICNRVQQTGAISFKLPAGTFEITIGSVTDTDEGDKKRSSWELDGVTKVLDANKGSTSVCQTWRIVSTGAEYKATGTMVPGGYYVFLSGFNIVEVTP